ncbi:hypothetical protein D3C76_1516460 [compost metagenome]
MLRALGQPFTQCFETLAETFPGGQFEQCQALVFGVQAHLGAVGQYRQQRQSVATAQRFGVGGNIA